jgi:predicted RNA-binding protein Jag
MDSEKAQKIIEDIFKLASIPTEEVVYNLDERRGHVFSIKSSEFERLATEKPDLTKDMIYLLKRIFNKNSLPGEELFKCTIDINDMQSKADAQIKMKALNAAEEARNLKTDVLMEPMSSYERMVVHSTLAGSPDISTESVGEGRERRLKVKYLAI